MSIFQEIFGDGGLDFSNIPESDFEPIPPCSVLAVIEKVEVKENSKKTGMLLKVEFSITDGPYMNRKVFGNLNVRHQNSEAEAIGAKQLKQLWEACGLSGRADDENKLLGQTCVIHVTVKDNYNNIKGYGKAETYHCTNKPATVVAPQAAPQAQHVSTPKTGTNPPWQR